MRPIPLLAALFVLAATSGAAAQQTPSIGGFGHFSPGVLGGGVINLNATLTDDALLGRNGATDTTAAWIGGGGKIYVNGVILGGNGYGFTYPDKGNDQGSVAIGGGGGGFHIGYDLLGSAKAMLYPYAGAGGATVEMQLHNRQKSREMAFGDSVIEPGQTSSYTSGFFYYELGIGIISLLLQSDEDGMGVGGMVIGAEVGFLASVASSSWQDEQQRDVIGLESTAFTGGYLRLTIGGGGFFTH